MGTAEAQPGKGSSLSTDSALQEPKELTKIQIQETTDSQAGKQVVMATNMVSFILIWAGLAEALVPTCDQDSFESFVRGSCLPQFNKSMESSGYQDSCPWPDVKSHYHALKNCVDLYANLTATACRGWKQGSLVDGFFLEVHQTYFFHCGSQMIQDPPLTTTILLIAPGIIVTLFLPLCVHHLTTWNTEV